MKIVRQKEQVYLTEEERREFVRIIDKFSELYIYSTDTTLKNKCEECHTSLGSFLTDFTVKSDV